MIAKQVQGSDFKKVLEYVHSKPEAKLIGSNMTGKEPESLAAEFRLSSDLKKRVKKCVYHVSLAISTAERVSEKQWVVIARAYLQGMAFKENQYVVYRHQDREHDHIHIIASRISIVDGSVVKDSWNYRRSENLLRQLEKQFGLTQTPSSWERKKRAPKTGEVRRQRRTGEVATRTQLQRLIEQALKGHPHLEEFIRRLEAQGVSIRLRKSQNGQIQGISYGLKGIAFQGRQLGKDYSWSSLESVLSPENPSPSPSYPSQQPELGSVSPPNPENGVNHRGTIATEKLSTVAAATATPLLNPNDLEPEKRRLRTKYLQLSAQVSQLPEFISKEPEKVDLGVTLLSLKSGDGEKEATLILTQSDKVRDWCEQLPRDEYIKAATQYIHRIAQIALSLMQKHRQQQKSVELER
jgi:hypothetical protein